MIEMINQKMKQSIDKNVRHTESAVDPQEALSVQKVVCFRRVKVVSMSYDLVTDSF